MPTVARVQGPDVGVRGLPSPGSGPMMRPDLSTGEAVVGLGKVVAEIAEQERDKADAASILEAQRKLQDWEKSWFDPNNAEGVSSFKGRAALELPDKINPDFDAVSTELLGGLKSPRARASFERYLAGQREQLIGRVNTYATAENDRYVAEEFKFGILNTTERAAQAALEGRFADQAADVERGLAIIGTQARLTGQSPEATAAQEDAFLSSVHTTAVNGFLARGDAKGASAYFGDNAEDIGPTQTADLVARMRPLLLKDQAQDIAWGMANAGVTPEAAGLDVTLDQVWDHQLRAESPTGQFKNGRTVVSHAGAVGAAQVMPQTGPEAARLAGLPWDPERFKSDADYNKALGRAYMAHQVSTFGSVPLALAAYNAGPGRVHDWVKKYGDPRRGEISMAEWIQKIPFTETRGYVEKILTNAGKAPGSVSAPAAAAPVGPAAAAGVPAPALNIQWGTGVPLATKLATVRTIADVGLREAVEQEVRQRDALERQAESQQEAAVLEEINSEIYAAPVGMPVERILTPDRLAFVTQKGLRPNYEKIVMDRMEGVLPKTDPVLFDTLRRQSAEDPEGFAKQRNFILQNRHRFDAADYETLLGRVAAINDPKKAGERADWSNEEQRIAGIARMMGLEPSGTKHKDERAAIAMAYTAAERELIQRNGGGKATPEQRDAIAREVARRLAERRAAGEDIVETRKGAEEFARDLSPASRAAVIGRLRNRLGREPTEAEIVRYAAAAVQSRQSQ